MKRVSILFGVILISAPAWAQNELPHPPRRTVEATISAWGQQPPDSGYSVFYRRITVYEYGVVPRDLWVIWRSAQQPLPAVGAQCWVTYHFGKVEGNAVEPLMRWRDYAVLDSYSCPGDTPG